MSSLPSDWMCVTLSDVANWSSGGTPSRSRPDFFAGDIPWAMIGDLDDGPVRTTAESITDAGLAESSAKLVQPGSVLIALYGSIGKLGITRVPMTTNQAIAFANPGILPVEYLFFYLLGQRAQLQAQGRGGTQSNINLRILKGYPFPLAPLVEQQAIAAKVEALFSELDAGVAQLEAAQALLKRYRQSVLKAAFEGRLTAEWREQRRREAEAAGPDEAKPLPTAEDLLEQIEAERQERAEQQHAEWRQAVEAWEAAGGKDSGEKKPRRPARPKDPPPLTEEELESLPEGWCWVALDGLVDGKRTSAYGVLQPGPDTPNGIPFVRVGDLVDGDVSRGSLKHIQPAISERYRRTLLEGRELLISLVGTVGRSAVVPEELAGANVARALAVIPLTPSVTPRFVEMQYRQVSKAAQLTAEAHEVARKTLNLEDLKKSPTIIAPMEEQVVIVEEVERRLSIVNQIAAEIDNALASAVALRQSILKRAFEGRLLDEAELEAVRLHPDYEPADRLLERIREQASAQSKTKKKTTRKKRSARRDTGTPQETT